MSARTFVLFALVAGVTGCSDYSLEANEEPEEMPLPTALEKEVVVDILRQRPLIEQVDVLFVIDNSCSMEDDQENLIAAFPSFMDYFIGIDLDYHIGVISTDMESGDDQGRLREVEGYRWIEPWFPDPIPYFQMMATLGTGGSGAECGRAPVYASVVDHGVGHNDGFFRDEAALSVIVISDEDDSSDSFGVPQADFAAWFEELKFDKALSMYHTIVGPTPDGCATAVAGTQHVAVNEEVGGINWSICDNRWDEMLEELAIASAGQLREFYLTQVPDPDTLVVRVSEGATYVEMTKDVDYVYDPLKNSVTFPTYVPEPLAVVEVTYEVKGQVQ